MNDKAFPETRSATASTDKIRGPRAGDSFARTREAQLNLASGNVPGGDRLMRSNLEAPSTKFDQKNPEGIRATGHFRRIDVEADV